MKTALITSAVCLAITWPASAQILSRKKTDPARGTGPVTSRSMFGRAPVASKNDGTVDPNVIRSGDALPDAPENLQRPDIPAPAEPIENVLLQKEHGPFMVMAHSFTGPESAKYAHILALELRRDYKLPAYVWFAKVQPSRSNIQGVQPTAPAHARNNDMAPPERYRVYDEAAVLVGNCKTIDEAAHLQKQVKGLKVTCLDKFPVFFENRRGKGLNRAIVTTNPFAASQNLYPGGPVAVPGAPVQNGQKFDPGIAVAAFEKVKKLDPDVIRWNDGPYSVFKNPGKYALQVAEYTGRAGVTVTTISGIDEKYPEKKQNRMASPLMTAADDAEKLAANLNKCKAMGGLKAYTYHTRFSSYVLIGSYNAFDDPALISLHRGNQILEISNELLKRGFSQIPLRPSAEPMFLPKKG